MNNRPEELDPIHSMETEGADNGSSVLERDLRVALQPVDAPEGFADRVMGRALASDRGPEGKATSPHGKVLAWPAMRPWLGGAVAAALVAGLFATETAVEHHRAQERRVQQATAQFETSQRITERALGEARRQVVQAGVPLD